MFLADDRQESHDSTSGITAATPESDGASVQSIIIVVVIFLLAILSLGLVYLNFPKLDEYELICFTYF